jgi:hypothetical protein
LFRNVTKEDGGRVLNGYQEITGIAGNERAD